MAGAAEVLQHGVAWRYRRVRNAARTAIAPGASAPAKQASTSAASSSSVQMTLDASRESAESVLIALAEASPEVSPPELGPPLSVAIVVPTYCDDEFLADTLQSVANQTYTNWRCYVVDDASPQSPSSIVEAFTARDERFVLARHGQNAGLAAARNTGLRLATEDVVQFLDADDVLTPWAISKRIDRLRRLWSDPQCAGTYGQIYQCPEETVLQDLDSWTQEPGLERKDWLAAQGESPFNVHAPLVRTEIVKRLGGFDEAFVNGAEDWELWARVLRHGFVFEPVRTVVGGYRQRSASMIREHAVIHLARADELLSAAESIGHPDVDLAVANASMPVSAAVAAHRRILRAATFAGIGTAQTGTIDGGVTDEILDFLDHEHTVGTRVREIELAARGGLIRGLGLSPFNVGKLERHAQLVLESSSREIARRLIEAVTPSIDSGSSADSSDGARQVAAPDVALIAETAADVEVLARSAGHLVADGVSVVGIEAGYVSGNQGTSAAWAATGLATVPYNHVALGRVRPHTVVGRRPAGPVTLDLLDGATSWGGHGVFLEEPDRKLELPDGPSAQVERRSTSLAEAPTRSVGASTDASEWRGTDFSLLLPREESAAHEASHRRLLEMRDQHRGETAIIIGNGPSLNDTDLDLLAGHSTFGVNSIFLADERLPEPLTYYVVEDTAVFKDNTEAVKAYVAKTKLFPTTYLPSFKPGEIGDNTLFFRMNGGFYGRNTGTFCLPRFSTNAAERVYCGQSVTIINLQLAYWFGYTKVVLIGMDFSYTIPDDAEVNGNIIVSRSDDPNHFHPDYFGAGKTWKDPHLDRVLVNYALAGEMFAADGREIVNATVGGKLELFRREPLAAALR